MTRPTKRTQVVYSTQPCRIGRFDWRVVVVVMKKRPLSLLQWSKPGREWFWQHEWSNSRPQEPSELPCEAIALLSHHRFELALAEAAVHAKVQLPVFFARHVDACVKRWRFLTEFDGLKPDEAVIQLNGELRHCGPPSGSNRVVRQLSLSL